jgi:hypothetical protein
MKVIRSAGIASAMVCAMTLALGSVLPAQAASSGWRQVLSRHYGAATHFSTFGAVVAISAKNIWALGGTDLENSFQPSGAPVAVHWNGSHWSNVSMPAGVTGTIGTVSAVSATDIWAATFYGGYVLHYNGTHWSVATHLPQSGPLAGTISGLTAFSAKNVWVFGEGRGAVGAQGTWHYDGHKWTQWLGNADGLVTASALSAKDIWAVGSIKVPFGSIERFNGSSWRAVTAAALAGLAFDGVNAFSDANVWVTATAANNLFKSSLLHFTNHWSKVAVPWVVEARGAVTSDGRGGLWVAGANNTGKWYAMHRTSAGVWNRVAITGWTWDMAHVPGTTSELSAGTAFAKPSSNAALWAFGAL